MPHHAPPATDSPDHEAAEWFANTQADYIQSHIGNLARCYLALLAEAATLAAGVCEHRGGNEHGNPLCLKTNTPI